MGNVHLLTTSTLEPHIQDGGMYQKSMCYTQAKSVTSSACHMKTNQPWVHVCDDD